MVSHSVQVRPARPDADELRQISAILHEGAKRMSEMGKTLWETDQFELEHLEASALAGELFTVLVNDGVVGTFRAQLEDQLFWPEMSPDEAVYLHKIAITGSMRGQCLTREIIRWAKSYAVQSGREYLRLDTDRTRPGLCRLYEGLGFSFHSYKNLGWIEVVRFQMEA